MNSEEDLDHYNIYRGTTEDFEPHESNLLAATVDARYVDTYEITVVNYYKLSAIDLSGNDSDPTDLSAPWNALNVKLSFMKRKGGRKC